MRDGVAPDVIDTDASLLSMYNVGTCFQLSLAVITCIGVCVYIHVTGLTQCCPRALRMEHSYGTGQRSFVSVEDGRAWGQGYMYHTCIHTYMHMCVHIYTVHVHTFTCIIHVHVYCCFAQPGS